MDKCSFAKKIKLITIVTLCTIMFTLLCIPSLSATVSANAETSNGEKEEKSTTEVISYLDVFENYYDIASERLLENDVEMPFTFEQFCEGYYSHEYDIAHYTEYVVGYATSYVESYSTMNNDMIALEPLDSSSGSSGSSSGDADYILHSYYNYSVTPASAFTREPDYDGYDTQTFDYSTLQVGDIVHESETAFFDTGHTAIISDTAHNSDYGKYIQTIEAVGSGVSYGMLDDNRMVNFGVMIIRVVGATESQRQSAVSFMRGQIGKPYSLNPIRLNKSYSSEEWYCSELVYAAYNSVGIDVGVRKNQYGADYLMLLGCLPWDIYYSYNTYDKCMKGANYIDIQVLYGPRWQIRVFNNTGANRTISYNSKMCFEDDAKNWKGLSNINTVYVKSGLYSDPFRISENWFATDIAISVVINGKRYVTYAHNLSDDPYTMKIFYN